MSTYYYMACEEHKVRTPEIIAVTRISGRNIDSPDHLLEFLLNHRYCNLRFFSEHDEERSSFKKEESK